MYTNLSTTEPNPAGAAECWGMQASGPCRLLGHAGCWVMQAAGSCRLLGHAGCWGMQAAGACRLRGRVNGLMILQKDLKNKSLLRIFIYVTFKLITNTYNDLGHNFQKSTRCLASRSMCDKYCLLSFSV